MQNAYYSFDPTLLNKKSFNK